MPSLGAGMDAGTLLEWYVSPGSEVHRGDIVALVETDKAAIEVEVFEEGVVADLVVPEGTKVPVGTVLAHLGDASAAASPEGDEAGEVDAADDVDAAEADDAREAGAADDAVADEPTHVAHVHSPLVRRLASRRGVDLTTVSGTGPSGSITREDVERAAGEAATPSVRNVPAAQEATGPAQATETGGDPASRQARSSPYARRLAADAGVEVSAMAGTGPGGAVVARDVAERPAGSDSSPGQASAATTSPAPASTAPAEPTSATARRPRPPGGDAMRGAIARAMAQSNRDIPHYHLRHAVDMEDTLRWLEDRNAAHPPAERLLPAVLVLKATALACRAHPDLNGYWIDDGMQRADAVNVGVAISLRGGGLVAPAIHDADQRSLDDLMAALTDLVRRTRAGRMRGSELTDSTITVTNLGDRGVEVVHGLIHPPQVALVGTGRITPQPWAVGDLVGVRRVLQVTLAADHRASDGHLGGLFLATIARHLQEPEEL